MHVSVLSQPELLAGTLNTNELLQGLEKMRHGLTDAAFSERDRAMSESLESL